jgi:hypothetical protein
MCRSGLSGIRTGNVSIRVILMLVRSLYNSRGDRATAPADDNDNNRGRFQPADEPWVYPVGDDRT